VIYGFKTKESNNALIADFFASTKVSSRERERERQIIQERAIV
jgi:hypothetical protein